MQSNHVGSANADVVMLAGNPDGGYPMLNPQRELDALVRELEFLNSGGYRTGLGWRPPLVFEDSSICPKTPFSACPDPHCVLMAFVPEKQKNQSIPCRHIPFNRAGETLQSLYHTASMEEIENTIREWLERQIMELKKTIGLGGGPHGEAAA